MFSLAEKGDWRDAVSKFDFRSQPLSVFFCKKIIRRVREQNGCCTKRANCMAPIVLMICVWQQGAVVAAMWVCGVPLLGVVAKIFCKVGERGVV